MLPNASEFLAINANLLKIAFGRAFAREIRYMREQHYTHDPHWKLLKSWHFIRDKHLVGRLILNEKCIYNCKHDICVFEIYVLCDFLITSCQRSLLGISSIKIKQLRGKTTIIIIIPHKYSLNVCGF